MSKKSKKGPSPKKQLVKNILMIFLFLVGCLTAFYPFYSDAVNNFIDQQMVERYKRESAEHEAQRRKEMEEENRERAEKGNHPNTDPFAEGGNKAPANTYFDQHLIGTLTIPVIDAHMPVFDRTNDRLLERGATVLQGTSFPVGGKSTHSVISAHRGLPQRKLFTELPRVKEKDLFILEILGEKLAYEVDQIKVIEPDQMEELKIIPGEDLVTLLTCTPYMINSHRLLVRGHRVPYVEEMDEAVKNTATKQQRMSWLVMAGMALLILALVYLGYRSWRIYQLRKTITDLTFYLEDSQQNPLTNITFCLMDKKGRRPVLRDERPLTAVSDEVGRVTFPKLPGNMYTIKQMDHKEISIPDFKAGWTKAKQTALQIALPKQNNQITQASDEDKVIVQVKK